jgi:uncharacterized protein YbjQ (UPF0145 family)
MSSAAISREAADFATSALNEVTKRLRAKGQDGAAARLQEVSAALGADTIVVMDVVATA